MIYGWISMNSGTMPMKFPQSLKSGDKVGIVALSSPTTGVRIPRVDTALAMLKELGLKTILGESVYSNEGYKSAKREIRANDVNRFIRDPEIRGILNTTGGYNSNEILESLDYQALQSDPKWFIGYSDITVLLAAVYAKGNVASMLGPMLVDEQDDPRCMERLIKATQGREQELRLPEWVWEWGGERREKPGSICSLDSKALRAEGPILAGNISSFALLLGTPFAPPLANHMLFLEYDIEEANPLPSLERYLWQIRQQPGFKSLAGLFFGRLPGAIAQPQRLEIARILEELCYDVEFPVLWNIPFGHLYPSWILTNGRRCRLHGTEFTLLEHRTFN